MPVDIQDRPEILCVDAVHMMQHALLHALTTRHLQVHHIDVLCQRALLPEGDAGPAGARVVAKSFPEEVEMGFNEPHSRRLTGYWVSITSTLASSLAFRMLYCDFFMALISLLCYRLHQ